MALFKKLFPFNYYTYCIFNNVRYVTVGPKASAYFAKQIKKNNESFYKQLESCNIVPENSLENVRQNILSSSEIKKRDIDIAIFSTCIDMGRYDVARSYYQFLIKHNYEVDYNIHLEYLGMISQEKVTEGEEDIKFTEFDEMECVNIIERLRNQYGFFDVQSAKICIKLLCQTSHWRKAIEMLDLIIISDTVNDLTSLYSSIAAAAFKNGDETLAWDYMSKIISHNQYPHSTVYKEYLKKCKNDDTQTFIQNIEKIFKFWNKSAIVPKIDIVQEIVKVCVSQGFQGIYTSISQAGKCQCCDNKLSNLDENIQKLSEEMLKKLDLLVKNGENTWCKDEKRMELQRFLELANNTSYDIVIDGLNFLYCCWRHKKNPSNVLKYISEHKKKILLIGKKHVKNEINKLMLGDDVSVFLTNNTSLDDIYILYAAIRRNVQFVSADMMRQHACFVFDDLLLQKLFVRWVLTHRCTITFNEGSTKYYHSLMYDPITQKTGYHWHIPCVNDNSILTTNHEKCLAFINIFQWMCLKIPKINYDDNKNNK